MSKLFLTLLKLFSYAFIASQILRGIEQNRVPGTRFLRIGKHDSILAQTMVLNLYFVVLNYPLVCFPLPQLVP